MRNLHIRRLFSPSGVRAVILQGFFATLAPGRSRSFPTFPDRSVALAFGHGPEPLGSVVLALAVDDLATAVEELRARNVPIHGELREQDVCYRAIIQAPDGNVIMPHSRKDGTAG
jgi:hypothetical protein